MNTLCPTFLKQTVNILTLIIINTLKSCPANMCIKPCPISKGRINNHRHLMFFFLWGFSMAFRWSDPGKMMVQPGGKAVLAVDWARQGEENWRCFWWLHEIDCLQCPLTGMMLKILSGVLGISLCLQNFQGLDQVPMTFKTSEHEPTKCQWKVIRFSYAFEDVRFCCVII